MGGAAGHLDPLDAAQIQAQMTRAATDRGWLGQLQAKGLARAREFDWAATAEATLGAYERAAARNSLPGAGLPQLGSNRQGESGVHLLPEGARTAYTRPARTIFTAETTSNHD